MTIEEAIKKFEAWAECKYEPTRQAAMMAISALRAQQTPLDRSRWEGCETCGTKHCWACKNVLCLEEENPCSACNMGSEFEPIGFCPDCGRPLTEEAWAELERRINGETTDN